MGSRRSSTKSKRHTKQISKELSEAGWNIISGFRQGINSYVHKGSLESSIGRPIAVVPKPLNNAVPENDRPLYEKIADRGVIISENTLARPSKIAPSMYESRIISGLSQGVLVVEAGGESTALTTAQYAFQQGQTVFSIPGTPSNPRWAGSNNLLRKGAILTRSAQDILDVIGIIDERQPPL